MLLRTDCCDSYITAACEKGTALVFSLFGSRVLKCAVSWHVDTTPKSYGLYVAFELRLRLQSLSTPALSVISLLSGKLFRAGALPQAPPIVTSIMVRPVMALEKKSHHTSHTLSSSSSCSKPQDLSLSLERLGNGNYTDGRGTGCRTGVSESIVPG